MTILEAIEQANSDAGVHTFHFTDLRSEEQFWASAGTEEDVPLHLLTPFTQEWIDKGGRIECTGDLQGWFLTNLKGQFSDFTKRELESDYLEPMRRLCKEFFRTLLANGAIINPEVKDIRISVAPEYQWINHGNMFGVSYRCQVPFMQSIC